MASSLNLWDSSGSNITADIATLAGTVFVAGEHIVSGDFNRILHETSLITAALADYIKTATTHDITYTTTRENAVTYITQLFNTAASASNISGGSTGQLLYQSAANTTSKLSPSATNGAILTYNTANSAPQWDTDANAGRIDGWHIATGTIPSTPDPNTIYLRKVTT